MEWATFRVGELGRVVTGKTPPSSQPELFEGEVPFLTPSDMEYDRRDIEHERHVSTGWDRKGRGLLPPRAVCVVCIGATIGKVCMTSRASHTNQQLNSVIVDAVRFDPMFVYYLMRTMAGELTSRAAGAATPIINKSAFSNIEVVAPPLETQQRIASILGAYDDLIEVNRRRVVVLEKMAQGLFEEWFVRFRFPGHESVQIVDTPDGPLPKGWRFAELHDVAEVAFGYPFKSKAFSTDPVGTRVVRIRDVLEGKTSTWTQEPFEARYTVIDGDLLIGMDGIFHTAMWIGGEAALNQRVARLRPMDDFSKGWLFWSVLPHIKYFEATISGTTVAHLGAKHLNTIRLRVADREVQTKADRFLALIDETLINIRVANERLADSRDLLLPRLISGQLSVETAERQLEEAA